MNETAHIELEPLDIKEEYDDRSDASSDDDEQEHGMCDDIDIKEEPLRDDFTVALCDICRQYCVGAQELAAHRYTHTSDVAYTCLLCHCTYTKKSSMKRHFTTIHSDIKQARQPFKCDTCHKEFTMKHNLVRHKRIHTGSKAYKCDLCHKSFKSNYNLKMHMRSHTGEKPYECNICHVKFTRKVYLTQHERIHTGEKPFECGVCRKSFNRNFDLKIHMRVHIRIEGRRNFVTFRKHNKKIQKMDKLNYERLNNLMKGGQVTNSGLHSSSETHTTLPPAYILPRTNSALLPL